VRATTFPGGAVARVEATAYVLLDDRTGRGMGAALAIVGRDGVERIELLAEAEIAGVIARRAAQFADAPVVWAIDGRRLVAAEPAPVSVAEDPTADALALIDLLDDAGVDVTIEHGEIRGEIRGLEIARVVVDHDGARLEVGVGRHDREAFAMVHGALPTVDALRSVIDSVDAARRVEAEAHPLRRLAPEGWLRWRILADPAIVGAVELSPLAPPTPRDSVKDIAPSFALGLDADGEQVVVAASVGIDLDLVPAAADARAIHAPDARLVIALPERDDHPVTRRLASALRHPADIVAVAGEWRSAVGS